MRKVFFLFFLAALSSCKKEASKEIVIIEKKVVKQSEMAALMLEMYDANLENKKKILEGESPTQYPKDFSKIYSAKLTDSTDRNASFNAFSDFYLYTLKKVYNAPKDSLKIYHNNAVNSCISCHETTCIGPIPRIKKLLIN